MAYSLNLFYFRGTHTLMKRVLIQYFYENWCTTIKYSNITKNKFHFVKVRCVSERISFNLSPLSLSLSLLILALAYIRCVHLVWTLPKRKGISHMLICCNGVILKNAKVQIKAVSLSYHLFQKRNDKSNVWYLIQQHELKWKLYHTNSEASFIFESLTQVSVALTGFNTMFVLKSFFNVSPFDSKFEPPSADDISVPVS